MRRAFVECKSRTAARKQCQWAAVIAKAEGGYWCFESRAEYRTWRAQV